MSYGLSIFRAGPIAESKLGDKLLTKLTADVFSILLARQIKIHQTKTIFSQKIKEFVRDFTKKIRKGISF
jgi:hypothetical protein